MNSSNNVTSNASLGTTISTWLRTIPLATRCVLFICCFLQILTYLIGRFDDTICFHTPSIFYEFDVYRIFTAAWFHSGLLHLTFNLMTFLPMGAVLERKFGSLMFAYLIFLLDISTHSLAFVIALASYYNPVMSYSSFMFECSIGFSGVIFAFIVISSHLNMQGPNHHRRY